MNPTRKFMAVSFLYLAALAGCQKYSVAADDQSWDFRHASMERSRDFDFLAGSWQVVNRRLKQRHVGSQEWDEFPARLTVRPLMGGRANIDEIDFPTKGWSGVAMRFYEPSTRE